MSYYARSIPPALCLLKGAADTLRTNFCYNLLPQLNQLIQIMPIYFQKVSDKNFNPDGEFYVKDSKGCNMIVGILFLAAFVLIICIDRFNTAHLSVYQLLYLSILPAVYMIRRSIINKTIMTINKNRILLFG
jgi:hypothetical protein